MNEATRQLQTLLSRSAYDMLSVLIDAKPMSGRNIATEIGVSPTTASSTMHHLMRAGLVQVIHQGRAQLWQLNKINPTIKAWLRELRTGVNGMGEYSNTELVYPIGLQPGDVLRYSGAWMVVESVEETEVLTNGGQKRRRYKVVMNYEETGRPLAGTPHLAPNRGLFRRLPA